MGVMKGYLDSEKVKRVVFWTTNVCLFAGMLVGVLGIWDLVGSVHVHRFVSTLAVIVSGALLFVLVNPAFGQADPPVEEATKDSAFADRLRKAKEFRQEH